MKGTADWCEAAIVLSSTRILTGKMHAARRTLQRISRSANLRGDFDVSFSKRRAAGHRPQSFILNIKNVISRNIVDRSAARSSVLSLARDFGTLARKEPPESRGIPVFGTILSLAMAGGAQKLHEYVDKRHQELGPIYREQIGPVRAVFVNSPEEFRRIFLRLEGPMPQHFLPESWKLYNEIRAQRRGLLFMDGDEWLHFRRILNKTMLLPDSAKLMCAPCQEAAESLTRKWKQYSRDGSTIPNLERQLYMWSIEAMLATLIGSRWRDCERQMRPEAEDLALMLHRIFEYSATLSMIPAKLAKRLKLPVWTKFVWTVDTILEKVCNLIPEMTRLDGDGLLRTMMKEGIHGDDAVRIVADFIIAAGDTTAITMQWALLLLSSRFQLQEQLFHDLRDLSPEEVLRHRLLRGVWREALRLHPVAPFLTRYLPTDATIGDYSVSKGDLILLSIYSSGRDETDFPEPNEFRPERWIRTKEGYQGVKNPYATLPFAMGVRSCIGRKLAETQMSLALAQVIKNFRIECTNRDSIKMILHLISVPSRPIQLKLTEREV
ncbi:cytochrome P450 315a1, mitochondrial isoform X1 [Linepithema humile]|uniref:cytochrome P450 315a1, mitochondrial isoform X1 n=3 Tax=Linepithema humile TaxID=83485 RepID=UPI00351F2641